MSNTVRLLPDQEYYLGLDIGTSSVGWAVTDTGYNIPEYRRKAMWGIHLFDEGKTAEERRMHRCARRRLNRRKQRITLLRELFSEEIYKVDPGFFERLDLSGLHLEDRKDGQMNSLFNDADFTDKEYHHRFPTIYHLRKYLIDTDEKPDIRLVYLACHHIVKYRGHFLFGEIDSSTVPDFHKVVDTLVENLREYDESIVFEDVDRVGEILSDRVKSITDKKNELSLMISSESQLSKELSALLSGGKVKISKLFDDESLSDESVCFKDASIDDRMTELEDVIEPDYFLTLRLIKQVYEWSVLSSILSGHNSVSDAKVAQYEQHKTDLSLLKKTIKTYVPDAYNEMFKNKNTKGNYCSYVGICNKGKPEKSCTQEEFCKYCEKILKNVDCETDDAFNDMIKRIKMNTFMPKQRTGDNIVLPYSVHKAELKCILDNVSSFYPSLSEIGDDGFSKLDKICMIQSFRIPYYVGPLGNSPHSWAVRNCGEKITPWNFDKVIDLDASAEGFMNNLTSFCTYIVGEKVLPKNSILYSYFQLFNEINNLKINGDKLPIEIKKKMVDDLFRNSKRRVTKKTIENYLVSQGILDKKEDHEITGIDDSIKSSLKSEQSIINIIGNKAVNRQLCEEIIRIITVFGDEKRIRIKLEHDFKNDLTKEEIKSLSKLRFEGWGRLSEMFLTGLYDICHENGQKSNIIELLENTNDNLMEIYHKYSFKDQVEEYNRSMTMDNEITYEYLDSLYVSPAVKRGIWRTISIVKDVVGCIGHNPTKVFVETTRDVRNANEKKRSSSRKDNLMMLFKNCNEDPQWVNSLDDRSEADLKSRSLYLYYTQLGRCMYCGRLIDFEELNKTDSVDRDHIYPQSKTKDDSIHNNMVLSCKDCNMKKTNSYPIKPEVQQRMKPMWDSLLTKKYITAEKYFRLTRTQPFSDDELDKFISRQLVETGQSVNSSISVLKHLFGNETEIVYVRANLVSEFRQEFKFIKCRSVNDNHHAKDAYLNIVVGNAYNTKFTKNPMNFVKSGEEYSIGNMYGHDISRNGYTAWIHGPEGTIKTIKQYMRRDNIQFTKYSYISKGQLFDDNLLKSKNTLFDRKKDRPAEKYGGYDNVAGACYSLIEYELKGKMIRSLETLHVHELEFIDNKNLNNHYSAILGTRVHVIIPIIRINSLIEWNGFRMHIGGRTNNSICFTPAIQLLLPDKYYEYCKKLYNYNSDKKERIFRSAEYYGLNCSNNTELYDFFNTKSSEPPYEQMMKSLNNNINISHDEFTNSDILVQSDVLNEILHSFHCDSQTTSFKKIGGVNLTGRIVLNKKLPTTGEIFIINQSPSGLHENKVRIN